MQPPDFRFHTEKTHSNLYTEAVSEATRKAAPEIEISNRTLVPDEWVVGLIFALAFTVRFIHLSEIAESDPFYTLGSVDGALYDQWARDMLARKHLGDQVIFLGPLYPMFIAGVYGVLGEGLGALKAVQAVLGSLTCVLVWGVTRSAFGRGAAAVAGFGMAFYGMHIFYGGTVMILNLQAPLVLAAVWTAFRAIEAPTAPRWAACGALLGLSILARQTTLLLVPLLGLWILVGLGGRHTWGRRIAWGAALSLPIVCLILPFTAHNWRVGKDFVLLNSTGGYSFYMGHRRGTDGTWQIPPLQWPSRINNPVVMREAFSTIAEQDVGHSLRASEVSNYWFSKGLEEIQADPVRWLNLELRKAGLFVNAYEVWNNRSYEISRQFSWILRLPLISYGLIAPLALLGMAVSLPHWRRLFPLYAGVSVYFVSALLFFVLSRYRFPGTVLMLPFAAFALVDLFRRIWKTEWRSVAVRAVFLALIAGLVYWPITSENRLHMAWYNLGNQFRQLGRFDESVEAYHASLRLNPYSISTHNNLAIAYEAKGDRDHAIETWTRVRSMAVVRKNDVYIERADRHLTELGFDSSYEETSPQDGP